MTHYDQWLIQFLSRWMPYGGGDEEILPEFGIAPHEFYSRALRLLDDRSTRVDFVQRQRMREFCCVKVRKLGPRPHGG